MSENLSKAKPARNSAFEILRIIAMLLIIAHHFSVHGGFDFTSLSSIAIFNQVWLDIIFVFGKAGVNIFVLISGYFLIEKSTFKTKRLLSLMIQNVIFSIIIGTIFYFGYHKEFSASWLMNTLFPMSTNLWWFMTSYLILYMLHPILNILIRGMGKKLHFFFMISSLFIWCLMPTILVIRQNYIMSIWFFILYLVASYIRLYGSKINIKPYIGIIIGSSIFVISFILRWILNINLDHNEPTQQLFIGWFTINEINNVFSFVATIFIFLAFKNMKMKGYKSINYIASFTLAIYLFHDHPDMRHFLWVDLFKNASFIESPGLLPYSLAVVLVVYITGTLIGMAYHYSFEKLINRLLDWCDKNFMYVADRVFMLGRSSIK